MVIILTLLVIAVAIDVLSELKISEDTYGTVIANHDSSGTTKL